jgi:hypothetical protein
LEKALNSSEELRALDVTFELGNARFDASSVKFGSFTLIDKDDDGNSISTGALDFRRHCWKFNLKEEDFGKTFKFGGRTYKIVGLKPLSKQYPILGENIVSGKCYKFMASMVCDQLK